MDMMKAEPFIGRYLNFTLLNDDTYAVSSYNKETIEADKVTCIRVPSTYNDKPVTVIGEQALSNIGRYIFLENKVPPDNEIIICSTVKKIILPDTITTIEKWAFTDSRGLESIELGNGVKRIGMGAFTCCKKLTEITIPDSVTDVSWGLFDSCESLKSMKIGDGITELNRCLSVSGLENLTLGKGVTHIEFGDVNLPKTLKISPDNPSYKVIDETIYTKDGKTLLKCLNAKSTYTVPEGVTEIAVNAFLGCSSFKELKEIVIPTSVKRLGRGIIWVRENTRYTFFYKGSKADWENINIDESSDKCNSRLLDRTTIYYYSETPSGDSWHYAADGITPEITHTSFLTKLIVKFNLKVKLRNIKDSYKKQKEKK